MTRCATSKRMKLRTRVPGGFEVSRMNSRLQSSPHFMHGRRRRAGQQHLCSISRSLRQTGGPHVRQCPRDLLTTQLCREALTKSERVHRDSLAPIRMGMLDWISAHPYTMSKYSMTLAALAAAGFRAFQLSLAEVHSHQCHQETGRTHGCRGRVLARSRPVRVRGRCARPRSLGSSQWTHPLRRRSLPHVCV